MNAPLTMEDAETRVETGDRIVVRNVKDRERDLPGLYASIGGAREDAEKEIGGGARVTDGYWKTQSTIPEPIPGHKSVVWEFVFPSTSSGWQVVWSRDEKKEKDGPS